MLESFFSGEYMPHGHCFLWQPAILWTTVISDLLIAVAYFSIPILLLIVINKRKDLQFRGVFILSAAFILLCGLTHLFSIYNLWHGAYGLQSLIKAATAGVSVLTAYVLFANIQTALKFPTLLQLEQTLEQSETFFESAPVAFLVVNKNGLITKANQQASILYGQPKSNIIGADLAEYIPLSMKDAIISSLLQNIYVNKDAAIKANHNGTLRRANAEYFEANINLVPITTENELHVLMVIHDISQQKTLERSLAEAKEKAESHSRSKSHFVANMSHEIRTPLNAILGSTQLIRKTNLNSLQNKYVKMIQESGSALLNIINNILDFSKIESGKMELSPTPGTITPMLSKINAIMAINVADKNIELLIDCDPKLPKQLIVDHLRLQQVLINLTSNSIKFTDKGYVKLSIKVIGRTINNDYKVRFAVEDSGIGLSEEEQSRLFEAFSQVDNSNTRQHDGSGLGLTISNQIVACMGSKIQVASTIGKGSEFSFILEIPAPIGSENKEKLNHTRTVILIEPHEQSRLLIEDMLQHLNCEFYSVAAWDNVINKPEFQAFIKKSNTLLINIDHQPSPDLCLQKLIELGFNENSQSILLLNDAHQASMLSSQYINLFNVKISKPIYTGLLVDTLNSFEKKLIEESTQPSKEEDKNFDDLHALIVEDNQINQIIIEGLLSHLKVKHDTVNNGEEAITAYLNDPERFDVIFMDIQMPIMDGEKATDILINDHHCKTPIVAVTASVLKSEIEKYFQLGMSDLIPKPIEADEIIRVLTLIKGRK